MIVEGDEEEGIAFNDDELNDERFSTRMNESSRNEDKLIIRFVSFRFYLNLIGKSNIVRI